MMHVEGDTNKVPLKNFLTLYDIVQALQKDVFDVDFRDSLPTRTGRRRSYSSVQDLILIKSTTN